MIATLNETTTTAEALAANVVADRARTADYADGSRCEVCHCYIQGGERIADLADGSGTIHVSGCSRYASAAATVAARAPQPEPRRPAARGASHGRTEP